MGVLPLHSRGCCARHASNRGSVQQRMSTFKGEERRIHTSLVLIKQKTCIREHGVQFITCSTYHDQLYKTQHLPHMLDVP